MATPPVSPLAPNSFPDVAPVRGVRLSTAAAGVRYQGRDDVMLAVLDPGTAIAGVFTQSATRAAPVLDCEAKLGAVTDRGAAILVNAGNANAFTGTNGHDAVAALCSAVSDATSVPQDAVFTASTGVIGERLPHQRIIDALGNLHAGLGPDGFQAAASAICTTDTFPKAASRIVDTEAGPITISGIAKGSGMIAPDMATMLAFVFTDATVPPSALQEALAAGVRQSFNAITVDGDTSTSDTVLLAATGHGPAMTELEGPTGRAFCEGLNAVLLDLAHQIVRDGEGATKFVEIRVTGADTNDDARRVALSIANSPLVKTAIAGEDPNWGRIVMAVGKSGARADRDALSIRFGDILVAEAGWCAPGYNEADAAAYMTRQEIVIAVDLALADGAFTAWTCDLTHGYIQINADYRS